MKLRKGRATYVALMSASSLLGLVFCNLLWATVYAVSKSLMRDYHPLEIAFLRYLTAAVPLTLYCLGTGEFRRWLGDLKRLDWRIPAVGVLTFFVSPLS